YGGEIDGEDRQSEQRAYVGRGQRREVLVEVALSGRPDGLKQRAEHSQDDPEVLHAASTIPARRRRRPRDRTRAPVYGAERRLHKCGGISRAAAERTSRIVAMPWTRPHTRSAASLRGKHDT